jgi:outer membrane protein TolC
MTNCPPPGCGADADSGREHASRAAMKASLAYGAALLLLLTCRGDLAQTAADTFSLEDAIALARAANPQIGAARANQAAQSAEVSAVRSGLLPRIGASETFTDSTDPVFAFGARLREGRFAASDFSPQRLNYPAPTSDFMSTAGATWMVFDSGRTLHQLHGARMGLEAAHAQTEAAGQNVAFAAIRAYYRALLSEEDKGVTRAAVARAQAFAQQAHDRVETGMALDADAMQADVEVALRSQEAAEAESNALLAYADLGAILGDPSRKLSLVAPSGTPAPFSESLQQFEAEALAKRPDLLAGKSRVAAALDQVKASHAAYGPQISTFANVQADNPHLLGGGNTNWTVGGRIEMQVFDGGARHAELSRAAAGVQTANAGYTQAENDARIEVKQAYYAVQTAERQYGIADEMLRKTQETLRTAQDRYGAGLVTVTDVLREQEQLRDMELNRAQSLYQWWIADAQLRLATGSMNENRTGVHP